MLKPINYPLDPLLKRGIPIIKFSNNSDNVKTTPPNKDITTLDFNL
ncbi:MAG: hypothetical protein K0Q97_1766 [Bacillota bacterium]|jgi:hypothetical protein|nr:hypothetical protein [Bacillota bacterium]